MEGSRLLGLGFAVLLGSLLCSVTEGQDPFSSDWLRGTLDGIREANGQIQRNAYKLREDILANVASQIENAKSNAEKGTGFTGISGQTGGIVVNGGGVTRISGVVYDSQKRPFYRIVEDIVENGVLRHSDTIHDPRRNTTRDYGYTLNLDDPAAKPVPIETPNSRKRRERA